MGGLIHTKCLLCGVRQDLVVLYSATFRKSHLKATIFSARRMPDRVHYRLVRCRRCGLVFSSPVLPPRHISRLYRQSECTYQDQACYAADTYFRLFRGLRRLTRQARVLEVGCGTGFFLDSLWRRGWRNVWGVEPSFKMTSQAPKSLRRRITTDIFRRGQFPPQSFDAIVCFHTLDHMVRPDVFIKEAWMLLKPGGVICIVVHDANGLSVRLFGERSPIFDIEHIYLFTRDTLSTVFSKFGFHKIKVFDLVNTYPLSYWLRMSGLPDLVKRVGSKFLQLTRLGRLPVSLAGGNLSLIAYKPSFKS